MMVFRWACLLVASLTFSFGIAADPKITPMDYSDDGFQLQGFIAEPDITGPLPAIVILPNADGPNEYEKERALLIAKQFGWIAFAADIYGKDNQNLVDREEIFGLLNFHLQNQTSAVSRINAAIELVKSLTNVDENQIGLIGYCFGGTLAMTYGIMGEDKVAAIASFHGGLAYVPSMGPEIKPKMLILSGGDDDASSDIVELEETLNAGNATWEITRYSGTEHAFTQWDDRRYDAWADARSWLSMYGFMQEAFGIVPYDGLEPNSTNVMGLDYTDVDGTELRGYLALPDLDNVMTPVPVVIIVPDWDGVNEYEQLRATLLAEHGYIAFAADIFGRDLQDNLSFDQRIQQATMYRSDPALFVQRIQRGIEVVKEIAEVDPNNIGLIGYCFGGTGVIEYAFSGRDDVKFIDSFHGGLRTLPDNNVVIQPYVLIHSGGIDDAHGNQTVLELTLDASAADWEVSRYSQVDHGFTNWDSSAYSLTADARSWESMLLAMKEILVVPMETDAPTAAPTMADPPTMEPTTPDSSMDSSMDSGAARISKGSICGLLMSILSITMLAIASI